jgi:hypothetical protein
MANKRWWSAEVKYEGHETFYFGSVYVEAVELMHALEMIEAEILKEWSKCSPYPPPCVVNIIPGRIVMYDEYNGK